MVACRRANCPRTSSRAGWPSPVCRRDRTSSTPRFWNGFAADARDVFNAHVLSRLDDGDLAVLATVNRKMRDVVFESPVGDVRDVAAVRRELARVHNFVGSIGRLAWAKERGCPWEPRRSRASRGVGTWRSRGGRRNEDARGTSVTCAYAAAGGHLEMLQWLRANGCPWDEGLAPMPRAAATWRCLQWARANGCSVGRVDLRPSRERRPPGGAAVGARERLLRGDEATCADAARGGHLEVLQWARANGARGTRGLARAADGGHLECCSGRARTAVRGTR